MSKPIATGIGYRFNGKKYSYPIFTEENLSIVLNSGGEVIYN